MSEATGVNPVRVVLISTTHELKWTELDGLGAFQTAVGGYIEHVSLNDGCSMYVNEEGKLKGFAPNAIATRLAFLHSMVHDMIVGDVVVCGPDDGWGRDTSLDEDSGTRQLLDYIVTEVPGARWVD